MDIGSVMQRNVVTTSPKEDLATAARLMREKHVGYLVVAEADAGRSGLSPVGVVTDRDLVISVIAAEADPRSLRVGDVMSRNPVTLPDTATLGKALSEMRRIGVRRLPVINAMGRLEGVVSMDDIIDLLARELGEVAGSIRNERRIESATRS